MRQHLADWIVLVPPLLVIGFLLTGGLLRGPTLDASVFIEVSQVVVEGGAPYRDVWDHKPPGIYLAEALFHIATGLDPWVVAWVLTVLGAVGTVVLLRMMLATLASSASVGFALLAATPLLAGYAFALGGGMTESLAVLPATAGFYLALGTWKWRFAAAASGAMLATAALISLFSLAAILGSGVLLASTRSVRTIATWITGGLLPLGAAAGWLMASDALPQAIDQIVTYNGVYSANDGVTVYVVLSWLRQVLFAAPLLAGVCVRVLARRRELQLIDAAALVWLFAWMVASALQTTGFPHYAILAVPPLVILAAPAVDYLRITSSGAFDRFARLLAIVVVGAPTAVLTIAWEPPAHQSQLIVETSEVVRSVTDPDDRIFVWGNEPAIYRQADRRPASRFVYLFPLMTKGYATNAMVVRELDAWRAEPPAVIVDASSHLHGVGAYPLLGPWRHAGSPEVDILDPLRQYVRDSYQIAASVGDWTVYVVAQR